MNKHKICPNLLNSVNTLSLKNKYNVFVFSNNFNLTKKFLTENKYKFKPYRFADCFNLNIEADDLNILSLQENVCFISSNPTVQMLKKEKDFINIEKLCEGKFYGEGQTICFIDTGIYPHLDFVLPKNRIVKFVDLVNNKSCAYDDNGHGTFVCGTACGGGIFSSCNIGIAPHAKIISIKALNKDGTSDSNLILDAMEWVYENYKAYNIGIVCMSFGAEVSTPTDPLSKGAEALWKRGIIVVAAAGNSGPKTKSIKSPGENPNIITVGALDINSMNIANFSSRGPTIYGHKPDLVAPAVDVVSCHNSCPPYTTMSGTSVATPIIAGICAIIKCKYPKMTNIEIKNFLISHCKPITYNKDIEGAGYICFD